MTTQQNTPCRGVNLGSIANGLPRFRETVVGRAELLSAVSEEDQPRTVQDSTPAIQVKTEKKTAITIRGNVECETLSRPLLVVKVPIEYLDENGLTVFEVPICPDMRCGELMKKLSQHVPNIRELELWTYPSQLDLCAEPEGRD